MPTLIVALLIVAAVVLLASSWLSGRRDRDPASSVDSFHRAMTAMGNDSPPRDTDRDQPAEDRDLAGRR